MTLRLVPDPPPDQGGPSHRPPRDVRVCVFGDSFVAGVCDTKGQGWVGRLVATAVPAGLAFTAYPLGIRRQPSVEVAGRWEAELAPRRAADTRVVFAVGANDTTVEDGQRRVSGVTSVRTLAAMIDRAVELDLPVFVVGPPPVGDDAQRERTLALSSAFEELCDSRDVVYAEVAPTLADSEAWSAAVAAGDGVHPTGAGYDELALLIANAGFLSFLS